MPLHNPSFEDERQAAKPPQGWFVCDAPGESPPDIHPNGMYAVTQQPFDGHAYVGLVVRDNGTQEGLGQELTRPLQPARCYRWKLYAARSPAYRSFSRANGYGANYNQPVVIRLWGGFRNCDRRELLAISYPVRDTNWRELRFDFRPSAAFTHLIVESCRPSGATRTYRGNVLIDNASPLLLVDCQDGHLLTPPDTLSVPPVLQLRELVRLLEQFSTRIKFATGGTQLTEEYYYFPAKEACTTGNMALHQLTRSLVRTPRAELLIAVNGATRRLVKQRMANLRRHLRRYGLPEESFYLLNRRKIKDPEGWIDGGEGVLLKIAGR